MTPIERITDPIRDRTGSIRRGLNQHILRRPSKEETTKMITGGTDAMSETLEWMGGFDPQIVSIVNTHFLPQLTEALRDANLFGKEFIQHRRRHLVVKKQKTGQVLPQPIAELDEEWQRTIESQLVGTIEGQEDKSGEHVTEYSHLISMIGSGEKGVQTFSTLMFNLARLIASGDIEEGKQYVNAIIENLTKRKFAPEKRGQKRRFSKRNIGLANTIALAVRRKLRKTSAPHELVADLFAEVDPILEGDEYLRALALSIAYTGFATLEGKERLLRAEEMVEETMNSVMRSSGGEMNDTIKQLEQLYRERAAIEEDLSTDLVEQELPEDADELVDVQDQLSRLIAAVGKQVRLENQIRNIRIEAVEAQMTMTAGYEFYRNQKSFLDTIAGEILRGNRQILFKVALLHRMSALYYGLLSQAAQTHDHRMTRQICNQYDEVVKALPSRIIADIDKSLRITNPQEVELIHRD